MRAPDGTVKVSVLVMTYNHVGFIDRAVQGALDQRTEFPFEILISEDCSTDGTRERVISWQQRYPRKIRLLLSERNIRSNAVVRRGIDAARGEYVALLDGDDYWTSPAKLQKQADFLDRHAGCTVCFHNATVLDDSGGHAPRNWTPAGQRQVSTLEDIWMGNFIATCSTMFRRKSIGTVPAWYDGMFPITDWPLHILNACHGDIGYIDEVMGVYRHHGGGMYSPFTTLEKLDMTWSFYERMNANLDYRHDATVRRAVSKYFFEWAEEFVRRGDRTNARRCLQRYARGAPLNRYISVRRMLELFAALWLRRSKLDLDVGSH